MYSTTCYLYQQITKVFLIDTSGGYFTVRYEPVYAKSLTVNKGVDNVLLFEFLNQDQKPVNITGSTFKFRLVNQAGDQLLLEKPMTILSATTGRVKVVLDSADTINIQAQPASYSIERVSGDYVQAVYVNANAQARADCDIVDSVFPQFVPSFECTVPTPYGKQQTVGANSTNWPDWALTPQPQNFVSMTEWYSSEMPSNQSGYTTIKFDLVGYTGTVKVEAAPNYESVWTNVSETREYFSATTTDYFNIAGFHPLLRLAFNNSIGYGASGNVQVTNGVVTGITINNPGFQYRAPPLITILGTGSNATATCTIATNQIAGVTITNGGSGYLPMQFGGTVSAVAVFSNGLVENVLYR